MKLSLVQILVVVANIQVTILKIEVEKGFMRTAVDHELVDPETQINLVNDLLLITKDPMSKGKKVNIPLPETAPWQHIFRNQRRQRKLWGELSFLVDKIYSLLNDFIP